MVGGECFFATKMEDAKLIALHEKLSRSAPKGRSVSPAFVRCFFTFSIVRIIVASRFALGIYRVALALVVKAARAQLNPTMVFPRIVSHEKCI